MIFHNCNLFLCNENKLLHSSSNMLPHLPHRSAYYGGYKKTLTYIYAGSSLLQLHDRKYMTNYANTQVSTCK